MNQEQITLIETVMDMISSTAEMMLKDPYHAPPPWLIENWWHTLNSVLSLTSSNHVEVLSTPLESVQADVQSDDSTTA